MSKLSSLSPSTTKSKKRIGRGYGSGKGGHTSTRGTKGQRSRQGGSIPVWFEGGQLPLIKRLPMLRGKGRLKATSSVVAITLTDIDRMTADVVSVDTLKLEKVVPAATKRVKIIATGTVSRTVTITGLAVTQQARTAIEKQGGKITE